jgi:hypothetical protein
MCAVKNNYVFVWIKRPFILNWSSVKLNNQNTFRRGHFSINPSNQNIFETTKKYLSKLEPIYLKTLIPTP